MATSTPASSAGSSTSGSFENVGMPPYDGSCGRFACMLTPRGTVGDDVARPSAAMPSINLPARCPPRCGNGLRAELGQVVAPGGPKALRGGLGDAKLAARRRDQHPPAVIPVGPVHLGKLRERAGPLEQVADLRSLDRVAGEVVAAVHEEERRRGVSGPRPAQDER